MNTSTGAGRVVGPGSVFVAVALYDGVAVHLNEATGARILPTFAGWVEARSWRRLRQRLRPSWGPTVAFASVGLTISAVRAAKHRTSPSSAPSTARRRPRQPS